jgi:hypothetical protein
MFFYKLITCYNQSMDKCVSCDEILVASARKYCSNKCQRNNEYAEYINRWKSGREDGIRGNSARNISRHLRRYTEEKYGNTCMLCGWHSINPITGKVPLEIDHIDGNSENNCKVNLRLICLNCHSLTPSYRNLNKGMGRNWRRAKYLKSIN